jgi:N-acetyl sugar amidotransferase
MLLFGGKSIDKQPIGPDEIKFCKRCVMSNQRPRITFNEQGICSACQYADMKQNVINWKEREEMLLDLLSKYRSKDGSYDCIVPGSGGKDSAYVAHMLKYKYGMHPLTITFAPFIYTDIGWKNYIAFKDSGFDNILHFPNGIIHRKLARLAFELIGDLFLPFIWGQKSLPFRIAVNYGIPLIFHGESGEVEYGGTMKNVDKSYEGPEEFEKLYFKGSGVDELVEHGLQAGVFTKEEVTKEKMQMYRLPPFEEIKKLNAQMHWFSFYKKWLPQENYYYAVENTGFQANPGRSEGTYSKYASLDDKLDGLHYYFMFLKFGYGRATSDAAHEVRDGHLTREEAVALVRKYDSEFPRLYLKESLEYMGITEEDCMDIVEMYRKRSSPKIWHKVNGEWQLRAQVS